MLRILIMSHSHGRNENVELAIAQVREEIGEFQMLIHLGDVGDAREIESLAGVPCYIVRGNTDYDAKLLNANVIEAGGHRIFATHGHLYQVDMRLDLLRFAALEMIAISRCMDTRMCHIWRRIRMMLQS